MPRNLTINPAPFKSSNLAIPPSPFSPLEPLTPLAPPGRPSSPKAKVSLELAPPPSKPLNWLWQCHICNRVYQLGVTRRCLDDGHYFCAGTTMVKRSKRTNKKIVRHKACASEFDYPGWKAWGTWRRAVVEQMQIAEELTKSYEDGADVLSLHLPKAPTEDQWLSGHWTKKPTTAKATKNFFHKDCWNSCDYPSECRWGKQYAVQTPTLPTFTVPSTASPIPPEVEKERTPKTTFDDILLNASGTDESSAEHVEHPEQIATVTPETDEQTKKPSMDDLLESAKRRKRRSTGAAPSPLGSNPPSPTTSEAPILASGEIDSTSSTTSYLQKALDDFELDVKKSLERAGDLVTSWASSLRSTAALEEEKAGSVRERSTD